MASNKAVFLDRDGTVNIEKNYLHRREDWEWTPGAIEAIRGFNESGFKVVVITNQAGIAKGLYTPDDVHRLHAYVDQLLKPHGARIDAYYFCPHHPQYGEPRECECRKPKPGLLLQTGKDYSIDFTASYMIGDKMSDIQAGLAVGVRSILVKTGYGIQEALHAAKEVPVVDNLLEAYSSIMMKR